MIKKTLFLIVIVMLLLVGCSNPTEEKDDRELCYRSASVTITDCDSIRRAFFQDGKYYLFTDYYDFNEATGEITDRITCYSLGENKNLESIATIEDGNIIDVCLFSNGDIAVLKNNEIGRISIETGKYTSFSTDLPTEVQFACEEVMYPCDKGLSVILNGKAVLYDQEGKLISSVNSELLNGMTIKNGFYGDSETSYLALDSYGKINYMSISWENESVELINDSETLGLDYTIAVNGMPYAVDTNTCDICEIDLEGGASTLYASGSNMLIPPTNDGFSEYGDVRLVDKDHLISVRNIDSDCEIVFVEADPNLHLEEREVVTIGCTETINSPSIKQAVYLYNASQNDYLAKIEEYELDYSDMTQSILDLTSRFNSGDIPDMFCGNYFDYETWGKNGMVIDLAPYIENEDDLLDSVVCSWKNNDGTCYSVFPSFSLTGFFTTSDVINSNSLSISDIPVPNEGQSIFGGGISVENLAYYTIIGQIKSDLKQEGKNIDTQELTTILEYATTYGIPPNGTVNSISFRNITDGNIILVGGQPWGVEEYVSIDEQIAGHIVYVGYPCLNGSCHLINPNSRVAISSDTEHLQACLDIMAFLFDDIVQKQCLLNANCGIPVVDKVLDEYLDAIQNDNGIDDECLQSYIDFINSGDQIIIQDNGLYDIIVQEIDSYYFNDVPIEQVAESLSSRINIYLAENG